MTNIEEKIEELVGTCNSFDIEGWSDIELGKLDSEIFRCETCGWWCPVDELAVQDKYLEQICTDCYEE